jgi:apolipoprotein N-acyltransferase
MDRLANAVILAWGIRRWAIAWGAGAISALAHPPFFAFFLLWLTMPVLVWLIDGSVTSGKSGRLRRLRPAFAAGWWFGFGYFLVSLWWLGNAFMVEADAFAWALPLGVIALPAGLALIWGFAAVVAGLLWSEDWRRIFALAAAFGAAEWIRGLLFTGFPWNAIGYGLTAGEVMMQSASLIGLYGLNVLAVVVFAAPATLFPAPESGRRPFAMAALSVVLVAVLGLYGFLRLSHADDRTVEGVRLRLVQPAVAQAEKWKPENKEAIFRSYLDLSADPALGPMGPETVLIWPESAFPFVLTREPGALGAIGDLLPPGATLVTGAARVATATAGGREVFNSLYVIDHEGVIEDAYDKIHLVPFGEYLPFQRTLESIGLEQLTRLRGGFAAGTRRRPMSLPGAPAFSPLICYEIIFPGAVVPNSPRPGFMLNLTNDAWFGRTPGPYQHLYQARVRAVEEGLPLVRSANTGISAVTDAYGRIVASTKLEEKRAFEARLPVALASPPAAKYANIIVICLILGCFFISITVFFTVDGTTD